MIDSTIQEILKHGDRAKIVSIKRLPDIQQDVEDLRNREELNRFQKFITTDIYSLVLPETDFEIRSLIIVASSSPSVKLTFNWQGKRFPLSLPATYMDYATVSAGIEKYLNAFLNPRGHHVQCAPRLPRKLLAVRSGLGLYGRNNICYVEGMGSLLNLVPFFSDIPCPQDEWHEIRSMDLCKTCTACIDSCPTQAITEDRFLINNERCLTYFNEAAVKDFPEWIDPSAHNSAYGCTLCQGACPMNKGYLGNTVEPFEFTEEETEVLLNPKPSEQFSEQLKHKLEALDMLKYRYALPRNLRVIFNRQE